MEFYLYYEDGILGEEILIVGVIDAEAVTSMNEQLQV